jgi:hypothetical protein
VPAKTARDVRTPALWISGGAAAVFAVSALALWGVGHAELSALSATCRTERCTPAERQRRIDASNLGTYETLSTASLALAGASLATLGTLYFLLPAPEGSAAISLRPGGGTLTVQF